LLEAGSVRLGAVLNNILIIKNLHFVLLRDSSLTLQA